MAPILCKTRTNDCLKGDAGGGGRARRCAAVARARQDGELRGRRADLSRSRQDGEPATTDRNARRS